MAAKFEVYLDKSKKFRFRLKAANGGIVVSSEAYNTKASCLNGIESVKKIAADSKIVELDTEKKPEKKVVKCAEKPVNKAGKK
jgi:uncharacterized protein YegP (UPF0339 family)